MSSSHFSRTLGPRKPSAPRRLSCAPVPHRATGRRLRLLVTVALAALFLGACGGDEGSDAGGTTTTTGSAGVNQNGSQDGPVPDSSGSGPRPSIGPGPTEVGDIVEDELALAATSNDQYVDDEVAAAGGEIVSVDDKLGIVRARFDVADVDALLRVRDELRAAGVDASTISVLDPGDLGTGSPDDPA